MPRLMFSVKFTLTTLCLLFSLFSAGLAQEKKQDKNTAQPLPLVQCWSYSNQEEIQSQIASDNANVFAFLSDGKLQSISSTTGVKNWETELGGQLISNLGYEQETVYLATTTTDETQATKVNVRALSATTGIVKWNVSLDIEKKLDAQTKNSINLMGDKVFFVIGGGQVFTLKKDNGATISKLSLGVAVASDPLIIMNRLLIPTSDKMLIELSTETNTISNKISVPSPITALAFNPENESVVAGDQVGGAYALKITGDKTKTIWRTRTGAGVSNITYTPDGFAFSSNDNFIYFLSGRNGKKIWKKRLTDRNTTVFSQMDNTLYAVNLNGDLASIIELKKGKTVNQITISGGKFFTYKPLVLGKFTVYQVNTGLVGYALKSDCQQKRETESPSSDSFE